MQREFVCCTSETNWGFNVVWQILKPRPWCRTASTFTQNVRDVEMVGSSRKIVDLKKTGGDLCQLQENLKLRETPGEKYPKK